MRRNDLSKKITRRLTLLCIAASSAFLLTGCGNKGAQTTASTQSQTTVNQQSEGTSTVQSNDTEAESVSAPVDDNAGQSDAGLSDAKNTALQDAGLAEADVTFIKEKRDYDDGIEAYDIEFVTDTDKYEYEIRVDNGKILSKSKEPIEQIKGSHQDVITVDAAKEAVLTYVKDREGQNIEQAVFAKIELDYDDGAKEYEIELYVNGTMYEFTINAANGEVLEMERENR